MGPKQFGPENRDPNRHTRQNQVKSSANRPANLQLENILDNADINEGIFNNLRVGELATLRLVNRRIATILPIWLPTAPTIGTAAHRMRLANRQCCDSRGPQLIVEQTGGISRPVYRRHKQIRPHGPSVQCTNKPGDFDSFDVFPACPTRPVPMAWCQGPQLMLRNGQPASASDPHHGLYKPVCLPCAVYQTTVIGIHYSNPRIVLHCRTCSHIFFTAGATNCECDIKFLVSRKPACSPFPPNPPYYLCLFCRDALVADQQAIALANASDLIPVDDRPSSVDKLRRYVAERWPDTNGRNRCACGKSWTEILQTYPIRRPRMPDSRVMGPWRDYTDAFRECLLCRMHVGRTNPAVISSCPQ